MSINITALWVPELECYTARVFFERMGFL